MLAEVIDAICVEYNQAAVWQTFDQLREEFLHVEISAKSRAYHPAVDGFFPGFDFGGPLMQHGDLLILTTFPLLLGNEQRMHDYLWGVGLYSS